MPAPRLSAKRIRATLGPLLDPDDVETHFGVFAKRVLEQVCRLTRAERASLWLHPCRARGRRTRALRRDPVVRIPLLLEGHLVGELVVHRPVEALSEREHDILEVLRLAVEAALALSHPSLLRPRLDHHLDPERNQVMADLLSSGDVANWSVAQGVSSAADAREIRQSYVTDGQVFQVALT